MKVSKKSLYECIKVKVNPTQSEKIQEVLFGLDIVWGVFGKKIQFTDKPYLIVHKNCIYICDTEVYFNNHPNKLVKFEDFFNKQEKLPENWYVENDNSNLFKNYVLSYLNNKHGFKFVGTQKYYGIIDKRVFNGDCIANKYKTYELTLENFVKLTKNIINREIKRRLNEYINSGILSIHKNLLVFNKDKINLAYDSNEITMSIRRRK